MTITKEERTIAHILRTPTVAVSAIEGFYNEERAVFLCVPSMDEGEEAQLIPVAMLLRKEDMKLVSRPNPENDSKLIIEKG